MLDKRLWSTILYLSALFLLIITLHQIFFYPSTKHPIFTASFSFYPSNRSYSYPIKTLPSADYQHLINLRNFSFTSLGQPCNDTTLLLVLIHSHPKNFEVRDVIRTTWGQSRPHFRLYFALGLVDDPDLKVKLEQESLEFGDLVQGSFVDNYRNMTYKHTMVLKYAIYHCPQAKYILKTDDDVFVNTELLMNFLNWDLSPFGASGVLFCSILRNSPVLRSYRSKWRVSFQEYTGRTYPVYCGGWAILYSQDVVFELYKNTQKLSYFWIDDVHITGTAAVNTHFTHTELHNLILNRQQMAQISSKAKSNFRFLLGPLNVNRDEISRLWAYTQTQDNSVSLLPKIEIKVLPRLSKPASFFFLH